MGITRELVRSVFSRNRSTATHASNARSSAGDKRQRSSVRSYLCGDEFNSVLAEEDSASVKSSEATVTQPMPEEDSPNKGETKSQEITYDMLPEEKHNSTSKLFRQEDAAIIIQSAFRKLLARRRSEEAKLTNDEKELAAKTGSPSRDSLGTSIEVQTGNSVEVLSVGDENESVHQGTQKKARNQVFKLKEDWDDSTVSSNISKMRIQSRLEASNRRERALAYAFSQQLRICSKKKLIGSDHMQQNVSWTWLERWMATKRPEYSLESRTSKQLEPVESNQKFVVRNGIFDLSVDERESCGSNDVSIQFDRSPRDKDGLMPARNGLKAKRRISRRKTVPSYHHPKVHAKVIKKECQKENEQDKGQKPKQPGSKREIQCGDFPPEKLA